MRIWCRRLRLPAPVLRLSLPCFEVVTGEVRIERDWDESCLSENSPGDGRSGDYNARFFAFTITEVATVGIRLESDVDTYLYLMRGTEKGGEVVADNDDAVPGIDLNSEIVGKELEAGEYTIEATTYGVEDSGEFTLEVIGLPDAEVPDTEPPLDCSTGGAVVDAGVNRELVTDCDTLLSLRDSLAGSVVLNWAADTPIADWDGVSVGGSPMAVTGLELDEMGLSGRLPAELEMLSGLGVLSLSGNRLRGAIPPGLGSLSNLTRLSIDSNQLSGDIPVELGDITELESLALNDNMLSGAIPAELANLAKLKSLLLANNRLSGEIPVELADLDSLEELKLAGNSLSGCIPPALEDVAVNDLSETGLEACASGVCTSGNAVDSPDENAGLVADCNALIASRSRLGGRVSLNWAG